MIYALGPYEQRDVGDGLVAWCPPADAVGAIDLRSLADQSQPGACFAAFNGPVPDGFMPLGAADAVLDGRRLSHWTALTKASPAAGTVVDALWQTLTTHSDPTGQARQKPLMPLRNGRIEVLCGQRLRSKRLALDSAEAAPIIEQYRQGYRRLRQDEADGRLPRGHHRRTLDYWGETLRIASPEDVLIPRDLPRETRLPHATVITENFDRSDATGWGDVQTWAAIITSSPETVSNRARLVSASGLGALYANSALSGTDIYAQLGVYINAHTSADYIGPLCRQAGSTANNHYWIRHFNTTNGNTFKYLHPTSLTSIGTNTTSASMSNGLLSRLEAEGTTIRRLYNGTTENSVTDTSIDGVTVGGQYAGIRARRAAAGLFYEADDWEAGDMAAGGGGTTLYLHKMMGAGL